MYDYATEKHNVTPEMLLDLVTKATDLLRVAGAATSGSLMTLTGVNASSWTQLAAIDRAVELGYLREVELANPAPGQYRIFMPGEKMRIHR